MQIKVHSKSQTMEKTSPQELSPAATNIDTQSPSSGRAELAGMVPTHCLSPSATPSRQEHKCGPCESEEVNQVLDGNSSVTLSRRLLQEFKLDDSPQRKVLLTILTTISHHPECYDSQMFVFFCFFYDTGTNI